MVIALLGQTVLIAVRIDTSSALVEDGVSWVSAWKFAKVFPVSDCIVHPIPILLFLGSLEKDPSV